MPETGQNTGKETDTMKNMKIFALAGFMAMSLALGGCSSSTEEEEASVDTEDAFDDELTPLTEEEVEELEGGSYAVDDEMTVMTESEMDALGEIQEEDEEDDSGQGITVDEDGTYTSMEEVAVYIHTYGHLPSNYITTEVAQELGYDESQVNLAEVAPGKSIGGDVYENEDNMIPVKDGLIYYQCDIGSENGERTDQRLVYSNEGDIYYTPDLFETFQLLY